MRHSVPAPRVLGLALLSMLVAACNGTGPRAMHPISLSVTTLAGSTTPGTSAAIQIGSGANSLTINQAQVVLSRIELSTSSPCATTGEEDDCNELEVGPTLVTLPVDGSTKVVLDGAVPAGTYTALHAKLDAVRPDDDEPGASAFLAAHPAFQGVSVQVTGVFTDASNQTHPFTFTSAADAEIEASFEPAVTVGTNASNLTIDVNVASWFKDATGAVIDPTNTANAATIVQNIARSFRAFEDDDHDGVDDRQEQTGGHE